MPAREAYAVAGLALLIFFVAFNLQAGWVYAVDALLVGLLVAGFTTARTSLRGISISRDLPAEMVEGESVQVTLVLTAKGRGWRFFVDILDAVPGLQPAAVSIALLRANQRIASRYVTTAVRRGSHRVDGLRLQSGGLTGLFIARGEASAPATITVYPRFWKIMRFPLLGWMPLLERSGSIRKRGGLEFHGLRDYRSGDSLRHVHWRSSARRGALLVREFEEEMPGSITLLVDARPDVQAGTGAEGSFEDLVRAAASIAWYASSRGGAVRLLASQGRARIDVVGGWRSVIGALADIAAEGTLSPADLVGQTAARADGTLIVLTPDPGSLARLAQGGHRTVGIVAATGSYRSDGGATPVSPHGPSGIQACVIHKGDDIGARLESSDGGEQ